MSEIDKAKNEFNDLTNGDDVFNFDMMELDEDLEAMLHGMDNIDENAEYASLKVEVPDQPVVDIPANTDIDQSVIYNPESTQITPPEDYETVIIADNIEVDTKPLPPIDESNYAEDAVDIPVIELEGKTDEEVVTETLNIFPDNAENVQPVQVGDHFNYTLANDDENMMIPVTPNIVTDIVEIPVEKKKPTKRRRKTKRQIEKERAATELAQKILDGEDISDITKEVAIRKNTDVSVTQKEVNVDMSSEEVVDVAVGMMKKFADGGITIHIGTLNINVKG